MFKHSEIKPSLVNTIKSIRDLNNFYTNKHRYGLVDFSAGKHWKDTHKNTTFQDWENNWRLLSPQQVLKYKAGVCYDTASMTDYYLTKWGIQHLNLFAYTKRSKGDDYNDDPTHTFTIYKGKDNKWRWLQGAWGPYKNNNWKQDSPDKLINNIGKALANASGQTNLIGVIHGFPEYGTDMNTFYHTLKDDIMSASIQVSPDRRYSKQLQKQASKTISFPQEQIESLRKRLTNHSPIWTTRVSKDRTAYNRGDILRNQLIDEPLYVSQANDISSLQKHPFYNQLSPQQRQLLSHYKKMRILKLISRA